MPSIDCSILISILGRHDDVVDISSHRVSQAAYYWRRTSMAILIAAVHSPGPEYPRMKDLVEEHKVMKASRKNVGHSDTQCISPFGAFSE